MAIPLAALLPAITRYAPWVISAILGARELAGRGKGSEAKIAAELARLKADSYKEALAIASEGQLALQKHLWEQIDKQGKLNRTQALEDWARAKQQLDTMALQRGSEALGQRLHEASMARSATLHAPLVNLFGKGG